MKKIKFHAQHYFNLDLAVSPLYFALLYCIVTIIATPLLMIFVDPLQLQGILSGDILRLDMLPRTGFALYELLLLPLYIKRLSDMKWTKFQSDFTILCLLLPVILVTILSDGGFVVMSSFIGLFRLMALILTFVLFITPTKK